MKQKVWNTFIGMREFILKIRVRHAARLCHKVLEMTPEEFVNESFYSFLSLYSIGADIRSKLPKRLVRELNDLHWDYEDDLELPGLPSDTPCNIEVLDTTDDD